AYHVHEYTKSEIEKFIIEYGFKILKSHYTEVNDLSFIDATPEEYINLRSYWRMFKIVIKKPSRLNILRAIAYPIVKIAPNLRMLIIIVAEKERSPEVREAERWG
ncbi:MAG: hypothetical protein N3E36_05580, partial [Sulfolobales archaeon]|nr:hypothetical protein [Sulfolobales archaeon]